MASFQEAARPIRDEAAHFREILSKGKRFVLKEGRAADLSEESKKLLVKELFFSSRRGYSLAKAGLITESEYQQMSMVLLFSQLGALFDLPRTWKSLKRSVQLVREPCGTFLELFLQPDWDTDGLFDYTGEGIFSLSMVLIEAQPLLDRYGKIPSKDDNQRWEVPLVYIICLMVYDALFEQPDPPTVHALLEKISELTDKLPRLLSSKEAGIALFLVDLIVSNGKKPEGLSMQFLIKFMESKRFYSLEVASNAASLSKYDIRARCTELLMNASLDFECNKLFGSFCHTLYLDELEKHQGWTDPAASKDSLRSRILDPAYVLLTYIDSLLYVHNVQYAIIVAADMERKEWLPLDTRLSAYQRVVDYYFQTGALLYRTHTTWTMSLANSYIPSAGPLGFEVLVQTLHQLPSSFPENDFLEDERRFVSVVAHKTLLSSLVLKYGDRAGASKFASYWAAMPVLSHEKQIEWAKEFLQQDVHVPDSFKQITGEDGVQRPDLAGTLADRLRAIEQPDNRIEIDEEDGRKAVEYMDIDSDEEVVDGDNIELVYREEVVGVDEGERVDKNGILSDYGERTSEEDIDTSSEDVFDEENVEEEDVAVDDRMVLEDTVESGVVAVDDEFAETDEDEEPVDAEVIPVPANGDAPGSQVETGYDAEESQGHSATDEEDRALPYFGTGLDSESLDGIRESYESGRVVVPAVFRNASSQLDPGYDAEDSQGPTDAEEVRCPTEMRGFETGYEAEGSQEHTDDEEDEEVPSEDSHAEEEAEDVRYQVACALLGTAAQKVDLIRHTENQTLSDMSAADELTTGQDEDLGAESSELEGSVDIRNDAAPVYTAQPGGFDGTNPSLLVRYASAAQREDDVRRASLQQAAFVAADNQGLTVAENVYRSGTINSGECHVEEIQEEEEMVDEIPRNVGKQDGGETENDLGVGGSQLSGDVDAHANLPRKAPGEGRLDTGKVSAAGDVDIAAAAVGTQNDAEVGAESSMLPSSSESPVRSVQSDTFQGTSSSLLVHLASAAQRESDVRGSSLQHATVAAADNQGSTVPTDMSVADSSSQSASIDSGECDVEEIRQEDGVVDHVPRDLDMQDGDEMENVGDGAPDSSEDVHTRESLPVRAPEVERLGTADAPLTGGSESSTTDNEIVKTVGDDALLSESVSRTQAGPESSLPLSNSERTAIAGTGTSVVDAKDKTESLPLGEAALPRSTGTEEGILRASTESSLPHTSVEHVRFAVDEGSQPVGESGAASLGGVGEVGHFVADATGHAKREEETQDRLHEEPDIQSPARASHAHEEHQDTGTEGTKEQFDSIRDSLDSSRTRSGRLAPIPAFSPGATSAVSSVTATTRGTEQANSRLPSPSTSHRETPTSSGRKRSRAKIFWEDEAPSDDDSNADAKEQLDFSNVAADSANLKADSGEDEEGAAPKRRRLISATTENHAKDTFAGTNDAEEKKTPDRPRRRARANSASSSSSAEGTPSKRARLSEVSSSKLEPISESKTLESVNNEESSAGAGSGGEAEDSAASRVRSRNSTPKKDDEKDSIASRVRSYHSTPKKSDDMDSIASRVRSYHSTPKEVNTTAKKPLSGKPPLPKSRPSSKKKSRRASNGPVEESVLAPRQTRSSSRHVGARDKGREDDSLSSASSGLRRSVRFRKGKAEENESVASTGHSRGSVRADDHHSTPSRLRRKTRIQKEVAEDGESVASSGRSRSSRTAKKKSNDGDVDTVSTASTPLRRSTRSHKSRTETHEEELTPTRTLRSREIKQDAKESDDDNASASSSILRRSTRTGKLKNDEEGSVSTAKSSRGSSRHKKEKKEIESEDDASSNPVPASRRPTRSTTRKKQTQTEAAPSSPAPTRSLRSRPKKEAPSPSASRRSTRSHSRK